MGNGYTIKCTNPDCSYQEILTEGIGYCFPLEYAEALKQAKSGEISEKHREFFAEYSEGAIDASRRVFQCQECGHLFSAMSCDMYLPLEGVEELPNRSFVTPWDLAEHYRLFKKHTHLCPVCRGKAVLARDEDRATGKCPLCGSALRQDIFMWD